MRLSDLIGAEVFDATGRSVGHVHDVRLLADGADIGAFGAALRVHGLLVGHGSTGARLGLARDHVRGPWMLKKLFGRRPSRLIDWDRIAFIEQKEIHLSPGA